MINNISLFAANQLAAIRKCGHRTEFFSFGRKNDRGPDYLMVYNVSDLNYIGTTHYPEKEFYLQITGGLVEDMEKNCQLPPEENWTGLKE